MRKKEDGRIGIITFHYADNFGAMLQAYGLKSCLRGRGLQADIVRYEPFFMTGRHWWFPYAPIKGVKDRLKWEYEIWKNHRLMGLDFFRKRANYRRFKNRYLIEKGHRKLLFPGQLKRLTCQYYIVGSDQIWNPDITFGLKEVYFGVFDNKWKKKVIAYAASLGGTSLLPQYEDKFAGLLRHVDAVSVREEDAVSYVKRFYQGDVEAVLDPVFFLDKESWMRVEETPDQEGYILAYTTEDNKQLDAYALNLSREKGLPVVVLRAGKWGEEEGFAADHTAGPAEFLGYIHKADYVVTNSFHAIAFSMIYQKSFLAFLHSSRGARVRNILRIHGLESRLYQDDGSADIDSCIDWEKVKLRTRQHVRASEDFLLRHILEDGRD